MTEAGSVRKEVDILSRVQGVGFSGVPLCLFTPGCCQKNRARAVKLHMKSDVSKHCQDITCALPLEDNVGVEDCLLPYHQFRCLSLDQSILIEHSILLNFPSINEKR